MISNPLKNPVKASIIALFLVFILGAWYSHDRLATLDKEISDLNQHISLLESNLSSTTADIQGAIAKTKSDISTVLTQEQQRTTSIAQGLINYQQQVQSITGTVSSIEKLSKIDPQLLAKYSKIFFLSEHYAPARLAEIPAQYRYSDTKILKFESGAWPFLQRMIDAANSSNVTIYAFSAYRSFDEQSALKKDYRVTYGAGTANTFSADQGYSEHQLGTALDLIAPGQGGALDGFDATPAYNWLTANAYKYGFILSYPKGNAYYVFEPWHWRFVGVKLATYLHDNNKHFYDLEQREIDTYLINLYDPN